MAGPRFEPLGPLGLKHLADELPDGWAGLGILARSG